MAQNSDSENKKSTPSRRASSTTSHSKRNGKRRKASASSPMRRRLLLGGGIISAILVTVLVLALPTMLKGAPQEAVIHIPARADADMVRDTLVKYFGPSYTKEIMKVASIRRTDFSTRHGAYLIPEGTSPLRAERRLSQGAQHPLRITVNGFRSLPVLAERIARRLDFTPDSLLNLLSDSTLLASYGLTSSQPLALFIDDSYELYWSASPEEVVAKIGDHYRKVWNAERMSKANGLGLTPAEIMTICSITDEESNKIDDKGKIGRLYINRLKTGMPLQADPTVRFALNDFTIRRVKGEHLKVDSPYNTYRRRGLPPGPIRTTSVATIDAVLNSAPSTHLYMCAKEDFSGYHNFASTYSEHLENARRYQKALDRRGIK